MYLTTFGVAIGICCCTLASNDLGMDSVAPICATWVRTIPSLLERKYHPEIGRVARTFPSALGIAESSTESKELQAALSLISRRTVALISRGLQEAEQRTLNLFRPLFVKIARQVHYHEFTLRVKDS